MKTIVSGLLIVGTAMAVVALPTKASSGESGNAARGKVLFMQCAACHSVKEGDPHKIGPNLSGIAGSGMGVQDGFKYSPAMVKAGKGGKKWTVQTLDAFIADPRGTVPGNRMSFGGISDEKKRRDIVAYLETL